MRRWGVEGKLDFCLHIFIDWLIAVWNKACRVLVEVPLAFCSWTVSTLMEGWLSHWLWSWVTGTKEEFGVLFLTSCPDLPWCAQKQQQCFVTIVMKLVWLGFWDIHGFASVLWAPWSTFDLLHWPDRILKALCRCIFTGYPGYYTWKAYPLIHLATACASVLSFLG